MNRDRRSPVPATSSRRDLLRAGAALGASAVFGASLFSGARSLSAYVPDNPPGERPKRDPDVEVLFPRMRVPLSFIIDDSTCLVNMGHYCMPQFAAAWPGRDIYKKPWKRWPREIPDDFVREFGEWCAEHGVKGKYSIVPNPACVGWVDRELPGWSRGELLGSLRLVRELMLPNWDIHPEMITHTRVIDIKTGRPIEEISPATMENSYPREKKSVDELASYLAYALQILANCDLPCEGVTTPGGFGNAVKQELSLATWESVRSVYRVDLPHYFKYVAGGKNENTEPRVENVRGLGTNDVRAVVNVPAGTRDWFGGWDGDLESRGHLYSNADATKGRMVELIERGAPAIMLCHWPGMYTQGTKKGLHDFQAVVVALNRRFKNETQWMKVTEIARYWAAKELTASKRTPQGIELDAPFECRELTVRVKWSAAQPPRVRAGEKVTTFTEVKRKSELAKGKCWREGDSIILCFDLGRGKSHIVS